MKSKLVVSLFAMYGAVGVVGCSNDNNNMMTGGEVTKIEGSSKSQVVVSKLSVPKNQTTFAFDIDGNGTADNRLGNIVQALMGVGFDTQMSADDAVTSGSVVLLIEEQSTDPTQQSATNVGAKFAIGNSVTTPPKFNTTDTFTINTNTPPAQFYGNITAGVFTSNDPSKTANPVMLTLSLPLVAGQEPLKLPVTAGRITFKTGADGKVSGGQINGAIKKTDVDTVIIPAVATLITSQLMQPDPPAIAKNFDTNMDGTVTADEVKANALISSFLAPDVQLFENGVYKPNPSKTTPDSLSLGLGFDAVKATF